MYFNIFDKKMDISKDKTDKLRELIDSGPRKVVVVTHTNPDGDAIGSSLAWAEWLGKKGHEVMCVVPNRYPSFLEWMPGIECLKIFKYDDGSTARTISEAELIFCLDLNQINRLEGLSEAIEANKTAKLVLIDHHLDPPAGYDLMFSYPDSSSTSFLVYELIELLEGPAAITRHMGENLYVGMMTDTGNFAFSNLTPELFRAVAVLVEKGVDVAAIHSKVYNSFTEERLRLLGFALNKMEIFRVGGTQIAYIALKESELRKFKFQPGDSEGFVNFPLTVQTMSMSASLIETKKFIRISLRSRGGVDVSRFARMYFEGGGHRNAAGGKSFESMAETIARFRKSAEEYFSDETGPERLQEGL
jgi:phosphoesterase RecJ-like protein